MVTLYNPETGSTREFPERRARVKRREGWVDPPEPDPEPDPPAVYYEDDE